MCWDLHPHLELWNILLQNYFGRELFLWRNALSPFQLAPFLIGLSNPDARHVLLGFTESLAVSGSATEEVLQVKCKGLDLVLQSYAALPLGGDVLLPLVWGTKLH
jgi:hypothetical protein